MKNISLFFVLSIFLVSCSTYPEKDYLSKSDIELQNSFDSVSYAIGVRLAHELNVRYMDEINKEAMIAGFNDEFHNDTSKFTSYQAEQIKNNYYRDKYYQQIMKFKEEGELFMAENKSKEGIITTGSGLQYKVLVDGNGPRPTSDDKVKVHYTGTHLNGDVFDSSVESGEPAEFPVTGVIKGWVEALQLMPVGSKWMLYIPQELGYGANPRPDSPIKPYQALIFEVELLEIVKTKENKE